MYSLLIVLQYIGIFIFLMEILYILKQRPSRLQLILLFLCISELINLTGYLFEMQSRTLESAILSVKFIYLGKPFIIFSMILFIFEYCKVKISRMFKTFMFLFHCSITLLVLTCEHHRLFYSSIDYTQSGLFPHLVLGHGIMYMIYTGFIFLSFIVTSITLITYYSKLKTHIERVQIRYLFFMIFSCILCDILFLCKLTRGYDTTALSYLLSTILLSVSMFKYNLFDIVTLAKDYAIDQFTDGLVVIDNYDNIIYTNALVLKLFPGLNDTNSSDFLEKLSFHNENNKKIRKNNKIFDILRHNIEKDHILYGYIYIVKDITDSYNYTSRLRVEVEEKTEHIRLMQHKITLGMADMIESRDSNTGGHVKRTSNVVKIFVDELRNCKAGCRYSDEFFNDVIDAAPMHDLGKIGVSDAILNKPGAYTKEEYEEMKTHSEKGAVIVKQVLDGIEDEGLLNTAINIAHYHHEKWDGTGYPCGLKGEEIPPEARIMALADVFDALVSKRCYKEKMSYDAAFKIISDSLGTHFDAEFGHHFLACRKQLEAYYDAAE